MCSYTFVLSPFVTLCSLRCPRDSSRQLLVIYLQHGPRGVSGRTPSSSGVSCSHGLGAPLTYDVPNTRLQGVLLLIDIIDFFLLSLFLSLSSHAFYWFRSPACSFLLFSIPPAPYFKISRETGSSRSSSAAFKQLPDPSRLHSVVRKICTNINKVHVWYTYELIKILNIIWFRYDIIY